MGNTHKRDIINRIAEHFDDSQENIKYIVDCFTEQLLINLGNGRDIEFRGFGVFRIKERPGRMGINPKTQEKVEIDPKKHVHFKMGSELKQAIRDSK